MIIRETVRLNESVNCPYQGIFWYINDELICFMDKVNYRDFHDTDLLHIEVWKQIKNQYKVNGKTVPYDYFPKGKVVVLPIVNNDKFDHYDVTIYINEDINTEEIREYVEDRFNLYLPTYKLHWTIWIK